MTLTPRAVAGVEVVGDGGITRSLVLTHAGQRHAGWLRVTFDKPGEVAVALSPTLWPAAGSLLPRLRRWLDLDADPLPIAAALGDGGVPGQRLPGCLDRFELAVRAVLGQQVRAGQPRDPRADDEHRDSNDGHSPSSTRNYLVPSRSNVALQAATRNR